MLDVSSSGDDLGPTNCPAKTTTAPSKNKTSNSGKNKRLSFADRQKNRDQVLCEEKTEYLERFVVLKNINHKKSKTTHPAVVIKPAQKDGADAHVVLASRHVCEEFDRILKTSENSVFESDVKIQLGEKFLGELQDLEPLSTMEILFTELGKIHKQDQSRRRHLSDRTLNFTPERLAWYNPTAFFENYQCSLPDYHSLRDEFIEKCPKMPKDIAELLSDPFLLWIACLPFATVFDMFAYTNSVSNTRKYKSKISIDDIFLMFMFLMERHGLSFKYGTLASATQTEPLIIKNNTYRRISSSIVINEHDNIDDDDSRSANLSNQAIKLGEQFSHHSSKLVNNVNTVVVDEVSFTWLGYEHRFTSPAHITKNPSKVHSRAFEFKCLDENQAGLRLGMIPVLSQLHSSNYRTQSPDALSGLFNLHNMTSSTWQVMKLLAVCGMLQDEAMKPWMVIADAAFASIELAAHLLSFHNIHFLGPIKRNSSGSITHIVNKLQLAEQEAFVTCSTVKDRYGSYAVPDRVQYDPVIQNGTISPNHKGRYLGKLSPYHFVAQQITQDHLVQVYQAVDGVQNLVFTFPMIKLHHHCSSKALRHYDYEKENGDIDDTEYKIGFHCLTLRIYYRVHFNHCDIFNRMISQVGCSDNIVIDFSKKYSSLSLIPPLSMQIACIPIFSMKTQQHTSFPA